MLQKIKTTVIFRYGLIGISFFLLLIVMVLFLLSLFKDGAVSPAPQEELTQEVPSVATVPPTRVITGTILSIDPAGEYMRVAVQGEGIVSVEISELASVVVNGEVVDVNEIPLMATVTLTTDVLADIERYDFSAVEGAEITVISKTEVNKDNALTVDERIERLRELSEKEFVQ